MLRFLADENFKTAIVRGVLLRNPDIALVRVQDVGLVGLDDPVVLQWAAEQNRVLLTHDVATMTRFAYDRVRDGLPMPGVLEVRLAVPIGTAIADVVLVAECSLADELASQVRYLPLR
jgi:predicted nuclease of predicted toxin-antitoxin system